MKIHTNYDNFINERMSLDKIEAFVTSFCLMYSDMKDAACLEALKSMDEAELNVLSDAAKEMEKFHDEATDLPSATIEKVEKIFQAKGVKATV